MSAHALLLSPVLLGFVAISVFALRPWLSHRGQMFLLTWAAAGALWLVALVAGGSSQEVVLSAWPIAGTDTPALVFNPQAVGMWLALLAAVTGTAMLLGQLDEPDAELNPVLSATALLLVAATMLWATAANLVTVLVCWALLDAATLLAFGLIRSPGLALRIVVTGQFASLFLLAAALQNPVQAGPLMEELPQLGPAGLWIALAIVLRIGVYPLHLNLTDKPGIPQPLSGIVPLASGVAGLGLGLRLFQVQGAGLFPAWLATLICVGLPPLGYLAWTSTDRQGTASLLIAYISALGFLALLWGLPLAAIAALLNVGLALPLLLSCPPAAQKSGWRCWPAVVAWLALAGAPLTAGFWTLLPLLRHSMAQNLWLPVAAIAIGSLFVTAAMLREMTVSTSLLAAGPSFWIAAGLLAVPLALLGLSPVVPRFLLLASGGPYWPAVAVALTTVQQRALWAALILPWGGGYLLWRGWHRIPRWAWRVLDVLGQLLTAQWIRRATNRGTVALGTVLRRTTGLWEGEHAILWTLLFAFILILSVMNP